MRTIKFKAKSLNNSLWVHGDLHHFVDGVYILDNGCNIVEIDPTTVCQFTGFKDLEGNDIYEGDILISCFFPFYSNSIRRRDESNPDYVGIVSWNEHAGRFELKLRKNYSIQGKDPFGNELREFNKISAINYEVIGSIHDPEWQEKLNLKDE